MTTFFEGEIISDRYSFSTAKWDTSDSTDYEHWSRFEGFGGYDKDYSNSDYVFMRWKELFLVPDHHVEAVSGASYAGFYYICFQISTGTIDGYYYHHGTNLYQRLTLYSSGERSFGYFDFR